MPIISFSDVIYIVTTEWPCKTRFYNIVSLYSREMKILVMKPMYQFLNPYINIYKIQTVFRLVHSAEKARMSYMN